MKSKSLENSEDYKRLFESFLQTTGIKPQEFINFLQKERAYCGKVHKNEQGECDGIYLAETKYILLETLKNPSLRLSQKDVEHILSKEGARLPTKEELKSFDAWKQSFRFVITKEIGKDRDSLPVFDEKIPITLENYWNSDNFQQSNKEERRSLIVVKEEEGATPEMIFFERLYRKFFKDYFEY